MRCSEARAAPAAGPVAPAAGASGSCCACCACCWRRGLLLRAPGAPSEPAAAPAAPAAGARGPCCACRACRWGTEAARRDREGTQRSERSSQSDTWPAGPRHVHVKTPLIRDHTDGDVGKPQRSTVHCFGAGGNRVGVVAGVVGFVSGAVGVGVGRLVVGVVALVVLGTFLALIFNVREAPEPWES